MSFAENLQYLRKRDRITQEELADYLQVSRQSISKWETGDSYPETEKLIALCDKFNLSLDELLRGNLIAEADSNKVADGNRQESEQESATQDNADRKIYCRNCGTAFIGNFCPFCGCPKEQMSEYQRRSHTLTAEKRKRIIDYTGCAFGILCALSCIIFVFFTGLTISISAEFESISTALKLDKQNIDLFYFFGKAYDDIAASGNLNPTFNISNFACYAPMISGTALSAAAIAGTATFFVLTVVSAVRKVLNRGGEKLALLSLLTFASYICGVVAFNCLCVTYVGVTVTSGTVSVFSDGGYAINGATIAGITVGSVFMLGQWICSFINGFSLPVTARRITEYAFLAVKIALVCTVVILVAQVGNSINLTYSESADKMSISGKASYWQLITLITASFTDWYVADPVFAYADSTAIFGFIAQVAAIALAICSVLCLTFALSDGKKIETAGNVLSLVDAVLAIVVLIFGLLSATNATNAMYYQNGIWLPENFSFGNAGAIALLILAVLNAGLTIVSMILNKFNISCGEQT